jgi:hypothetical protein
MLINNSEQLLYIRYGIFLSFAGGGAFIGGVKFFGQPRSMQLSQKGVGGPTKSLNESSQGGGDVWYPLESGHQEGGIGVLGMSVYTTKPSKLGVSSSPKIVSNMPATVISFWGV